jgi:aldehyde:ferredoxin oxidoreductase
VPNGFWDRILRVDLTSGKTWEEHPGEAWFRKNIGGRAMIGHYLLTEVPQGIDAFDPENRLIFAMGILTGTPFPGAGRHSCGAKSPLNGGFGESEAGGFWGAELKHAGYDGIVIQGKAEKPVYLWITEDSVEIHDAGHLWGKITGDVQDAIREQHGDRLIRVLQAGVAGENLVRYALVCNDLNEMSGRTGMGAVMGSKNLKAIAVRGNKKVGVANNDPVKETSMWVAKTMDENHYNFHHYGTGALMKGKHLEGHLIVRNFQDGQWDKVEEVDAVTFKTKYGQRMDGCYACSVRCKKRAEVNDGRFNVVTRYGGPEYETLGATGTNLMVDDLALLCEVNQKLNYLGLDSVSTGGTIAWAMECYERGVLTKDDTGGIELTFGNGDAVLRLLDEIAYRSTPFGTLLAEGSYRAAQQIGRGSEKYVVAIKGMEVAMHDPRGMDIMLKNYPVNPTGGDHTGAAQHRTSLRNTVGVCQFLQYDEPRIVSLVNGVTGWDTTEEELADLAKRGLAMARIYNMREGKTRADDRLPDRLHEPIKYGPLSDKLLTRERVDEVVTEYYRGLGWDEQTGIPTVETRQKLGLDDPAYAASVAAVAG